MRAGSLPLLLSIGQGHRGRVPTLEPVRAVCFRFGLQLVSRPLVAPTG